MPPQRPALVLVAGFAGSGKTEFGAFLSALTGWSLLDKDVVTRPLTEALLVSSGGDPHDRHTAVYREKVRPLEYRSLMAAAFHNGDCDVSTIVAAPFLEEVSDRDWVARVANRCAAQGTDLAVVWVSCDSASMHEYLATRGAARVAALREASGLEFGVWHGSARDISASIDAGASAVVVTALADLPDPFPPKDIAALQALVDARAPGAAARPR